MSLNLNDQSTNGNTLTNHGATEYTSDFPYAAITEAVSLVAASSQYLQAAASSSLEITGALSLGMWLKPTTNPASNGIVYCLLDRYSGANDSTSAYFLQIQNISGTIFFQFGGVQGTSLDVANFSVTPTTGAWHHYGFTFDGNKNYKMFVDNVQQDTTKTLSNTGINVGTQDLFVGRLPSGGSFYDGKMADIRVYAEVHNWSDYNSLVSPTQANLKAWWPFQAIGSGLLMFEI